MEASDSSEASTCVLEGVAEAMLSYLDWASVADDPAAWDSLGEALERISGERQKGEPGENRFSDEMACL